MALFHVAPGASISFSPPSWGFDPWVNIRRGLEVDGWAARALTRRVSFRVPRQPSFNGRSVACPRVGSSKCAEPRLEDVAYLVRAALEEV
jgi:hypothetical protein